MRLGGYVETDRLGGGEVDDKLRLGGLLATAARPETEPHVPAAMCERIHLKLATSAKASMVPCFSVDSSGSSVSRYLGTGQFSPQPTAVTSAKPMPAAKFADRVASGALMIALPARHRRQ